jgi:CHAD domain-containing protein
MRYPNWMDHLEVLREKIGRLRDEIASLQELNDQYRLHGRNGAHEQAQIAHGQRQERLQEIQQELVQLAGLGRRVLSVEQRKQEHRSRLNPVKKAS